MPFHKSSDIVFGVYLTLYHLALHTGGCSNVMYPPSTHTKIKFCEISFVHTIHCSCQVLSKLCTEEICVMFQMYVTTRRNIIGKRDFAKFDFKMSFGGVHCIARPPPVLFALFRANTLRSFDATRWVPFQYPMRRLIVISRGREIGSLNHRIALKFDRAIRQHCCRVACQIAELLCHFK